MMMELHSAAMNIVYELRNHLGGKNLSLLILRRD